MLKASQARDTPIYLRYIVPTTSTRYCRPLKPINARGIAVILNIG